MLSRVNPSGSVAIAAVKSPTAKVSVILLRVPDS